MDKLQNNGVTHLSSGERVGIIVDSACLWVRIYSFSEEKRKTVGTLLFSLNIQFILSSTKQIHILCYESV